MRRLALAFLVVLAPAAAHATTPATASLPEMFAAADYVAVVEIIGRRTLADNCGVVARGRVIRSLKGAPSEVLEFGYQTRAESGHRYLLFLTRPGITTTNPFAHAASEYRRRCAPVHTVNEVIHDGRGAMPIEKAAAFGGDWAVRLPREGVRVGATVICKIHDTPEFSWRRDFVDVLESDIVELLQGLTTAGEQNTLPRHAAPSETHHVTLRNASDADVVVFLRQYRATNYHRDDTSVAKDRPDRAELVRVPGRGNITLTLRDFNGGSVAWSARPLTSEGDMCTGSIELTCAGYAFEISLAPDGCFAR